MPPRPLDLRGFYAILDPDACQGRDPLVVARAILDGGCAALQLRAKRSAPTELQTLGAALRSACTDAGVPFYVNDSVDLAQALAADGVHLGQDDMAIEDARARLGPDAVIGLSTHDLDQALEAERRGADLVGFGPIFVTRTKDDPDPVVGTEALATVCARLQPPVVAIGGIGLDEAPAVAEAGAPLAAAIAAVCAANDPSAAARSIHRALRGA